MANIKSQIKRIRTNEVARLRNKQVKSALKTSVRRFREAADAGNSDEALVAIERRLAPARQGSQQGCHPPQPGRQPQVGDGHRRPTLSDLSLLAVPARLADRARDRSS